MAKQLVANVEVDGTWYGPDYPQNKLTADVAEKITNPAAWEAPPGDRLDLRTRADDFGGPEGEQPNLRAAEAAAGDEVERARLEAMDPDELKAEAASRGVTVEGRATKANLVDALLAART